MNYALRPVTLTDYDFLYDLNKATMKMLVEKTWGWDEEFQQSHFRQHFTTTDTYLITVGNCNAGKLQCEKTAHSIFLATIQLLPDYQRKGIGTAIIQALISEARADNKDITLQVLKANSAAKRFYERNGFVAYSETTTHDLMRYPFINRRGKKSKHD